jgi:hypothetical protein
MQIEDCYLLPADVFAEFYADHDECIEQEDVSVLIREIERLYECNEAREEERAVWLRAKHWVEENGVPSTDEDLAVMMRTVAGLNIGLFFRTVEVRNGVDAHINDLDRQIGCNLARIKHNKYLITRAYFISQALSE